MLRPGGFLALEVRQEQPWLAAPGSFESFNVLTWLQELVRRRQCFFSEAAREHGP